jgi:hypothetical protein
MTFKTPVTLLPVGIGFLISCLLLVHQPNDIRVILTTI